MQDSDQRQYSKEWIQYGRLQPMYDSKIHRIITRPGPSCLENADLVFKNNFLNYIKSNNRICLSGLDDFKFVDVIMGCTHYLDDLYQRFNNIYVFENDYKYHWRLNNEIIYARPNHLEKDSHLIISAPFPSLGDIRSDMGAILEECLFKNIKVHIDAAWMIAASGIQFDFSHPAIADVGFSLSKGGLTNNRIGIRLSKTQQSGPITIMNEFNMVSKIMCMSGIEFMSQIPPTYLWDTYEDAYLKIMNDFKLTPTKIIHTAFDSQNNLVGVRSLLRSLVKVSP